MELAAYGAACLLEVVGCGVEVVVYGLLIGYVDAAAACCGEELCEGLDGAVVLLECVDIGLTEESPLATLFVAVVGDVVVESVGVVVAGVLALVVEVHAEVFSFDVVSLVVGHLQGVDAFASLDGCYLPVCLGTDGAVDEAGLDALADLGVGVGAEEDVGGALGGVVEVVGVGRHGLGAAELVDDAAESYYALCAVGLAGSDVAVESEVVDVDVLVLCGLAEGCLSEGVHLAYGSEFLPNGCLAVGLGAALGHAECGLVEVYSCEDVVGDVDGCGVCGMDGDLAECCAAVEGVVADVFEPQGEVDVGEGCAVHEGSVVDVHDVVGEVYGGEGGAVLEAVACEVAEACEVLEVSEVGEFCILVESVLEALEDASFLRCDFSVAVEVAATADGSLAHDVALEDDESEFAAEASLCLGEFLEGALEVVVDGLLRGDVEACLDGAGEESAELHGGGIEGCLVGIVLDEHPMAVGGEVVVGDVAVDAIGGRGGVAGVVRIDAEVLRSLVAADAGGHLEGVDEGLSLYGCEPPPGGLGGDGGGGAVDEAGAHAIADVAVGGGAEEDVVVVGAVVGVEVVDAFAHGSRLAEFEAHGAVGLGDDGLCAVGLASCEVAPCANVVEVVLLLECRFDELSSREVAYFIDVAEVLPLGLGGDGAARSLEHSEGCSREIHALEDGVAELDVLRTDAAEDDFRETRAGGEGSVADALDADGEVCSRHGSAAAEGSSADGLERGGEVAGEDLAAIEGFVADGGDALREHERLQRSASLEGAGSDVPELLGELDGGEDCAVLEGSLREGGQTGEVVELREGGEALSAEGIAEVLDGSCLAVGEGAVGVGIEVLHAEFLQGSVADGHGACGVVHGLDADDGLRITAVAAGGASDALRVRIELGEHKVAVAAATPAPVDVEAAVAIVAVADEGMAAIGVAAAEVDGPTGSDLVVKVVVPAVAARVVGGDVLDAVAVAEVVPEGIVDLSGLCAGGGVGVVHVYGYATIVHELRHGFLLLAVAAVGVDHVVPVEG